MKSLNKCQLLGNLGKEPEIIKFENGNTLAKFSIATGEKYKKPDGTEEVATTWHNVVVWGKTAELVEKYVNKGDRLYLSGKMVNRQWEDKEGNKRTSHEIICEDFILLGGKKIDSQKPENTTAPVENPGADGDDLPF